MKSPQLFGLLLVAAVNAVPITENELTARGDPVGALADGEKLLVNGDQLSKAEGIALEKPEIDYEFLNFTAPVDTDTKLMSRSCTYTTSYVIDKTQIFLDWDVQMGPVVRGAGEGITAYIATGWSVSNSVQGSAGLDFKVIKNYLGGEFGINYSRTWTTTTTDQYSTVVKNGMAGVWVTQPWTNRKYGRTFSGCVGSMTQTGTFMADSHALPRLWKLCDVSAFHY
ncbi:hypothetical protein CI238_12473 [Colletotrichum incanum]|uniref:Uncharacterized protein n=1 Tax=Colletotrichum incanum TaxID=1573173 RepID=A0A161W3P5_COLIC|nr:hypothetical protein CI238_12473 [Colletotrichum incanum]OHW95373.1 hypothetical protein CSPAE12_06014 [Colletotrichum incanum]